MLFRVLTPVRLTFLPDTLLPADIVEEHELGDNLVEPAEGDDVTGEEEQIGRFAELDAREAAMEQRSAEIDELRAVLDDRGAEWLTRARELDERAAALTAAETASAARAAELDAREAAIAAKARRSTAKPATPEA